MLQHTLQPQVWHLPHQRVALEVDGTADLVISPFYGQDFVTPLICDLHISYHVATVILKWVNGSSVRRRLLAGAPDPAFAGPAPALGRPRDHFLQQHHQTF